MLVFNADDWGRSKVDTDAALGCFRRGRVASVSAMVFMEDSERAAEMAREAGISVGLHLNFTETFSGQGASTSLREHLQRVMRFLGAHKFSFLVYHPLLRRHFRYLYECQIEEFLRLYKKPAAHIDGHEHMHLCTNMLFSGLIKPGQKVRRQQSFWPDKRGLVNRSYRHLVDQWLVRRYRTVDYFLELAHYLEGNRMLRVGELASMHAVEMMAHPAMPAEYAYLTSDDCAQLLMRLQAT